MGKRKSIEEALADWEDARLEPDDDSEESEDWYADDGARDDNISIDEDGTEYRE